MGFFSWKTNDTHRTIWNKFTDAGNTFRVFLRDDKGNEWIEENYEGYGEFGGKDYYALVAEMNGFEASDDTSEAQQALRCIGIALSFYQREHWDADLREHMKGRTVLHPNLCEYEMPWFNQKPEVCDTQGFFEEEE